MKNLQDHFTDWEAHVFGFGYGTGESHTVPAVRQFFEQIVLNRSNYDHTTLEAALGPVVAWLLINTLCLADVIEYGTSPRYGWLTRQGEALCSFVLTKSADDSIGVLVTMPSTVRRSGSSRTWSEMSLPSSTGWSVTLTWNELLSVMLASSTTD